MVRIPLALVLLLQVSLSTNAAAFTFGCLASANVTLWRQLQEKLIELDQLRDQTKQLEEKIAGKIWSIDYAQKRIAEKRPRLQHRYNLDEFIEAEIQSIIDTPDFVATMTENGIDAKTARDHLKAAYLGLNVEGKGDPFSFASRGNRDVVSENVDFKEYRRFTPQQAAGVVKARHSYAGKPELLEAHVSSLSGLFANSNLDTRNIRKSLIAESNWSSCCALKCFGCPWGYSHKRLSSELSQENKQLELDLKEITVLKSLAVKEIETLIAELKKPK